MRAMLMQERACSLCEYFDGNSHTQRTQVILMRRSQAQLQPGTCRRLCWDTASRRMHSTAQQSTITLTSITTAAAYMLAPNRMRALHPLANPAQAPGRPKLSQHSRTTGAGSMHLRIASAQSVCIELLLSHGAELGAKLCARGNAAVEQI